MFQTKRAETSSAAAEKNRRGTEPTSDGEDRPQHGFGNWGVGPPLKTSVSGRHKDFADVAGLYSPGRWAPEHRAAVPTLSIGKTDGMAKGIYDQLVALIKQIRGMSETRFQSGQGNRQHATIRRADDHGWRSYVDQDTLAAWRKWRSAGTSGTPADAPRSERRTSQKILKDPDWKIHANRTHSFTTGVRSGFGSELVRNPAVFDRKLGWRKYDVDAFDPWREQGHRVYGKIDKP